MLTFFYKKNDLSLKSDIINQISQIQRGNYLKKKMVNNFMLHSEKRFYWIKENYLFKRLSLIWKNDLFESNKICLVQKKYLWIK